MKYDVVILLGSQPDIKTWKFPEQIYECIEHAKQILESNTAPYVIASGKWSIALDNIGLTQPFRECDELERLLIEAGISKDSILKEGDSKDTISNLYYLKKDIFLPRGWREVLFIVADFRIERLQFLCDKILGPDFKVGFDPIKSEPGASYNEPRTFMVQKQFLEQMETGDHMWLADKFYTAPMYLQNAANDRLKYGHLLTK